MKKKTTGYAFTLVELMVVIVIIAFVVALLFPALRAARRKADAMGCASNLRQLGIACATYATDFDGYFPPVAPTTEYGPSGPQRYTAVFRPWPGYFIHANYVDSRKVYYCRAADMEQDLTVSDPNADPEDEYQLYCTNDWVGGAYGMNLGVSCNPVDQVAEWQFLPVQASTICSPGDKILMGDRLPVEDEGGQTYVIITNSSWGNELFLTECALWGIHPEEVSPDDSMYFAKLDFRHPGRTANVLFCDFHVATLRSNAPGLYRKGALSTYRNRLNSAESCDFRWAAYATKPQDLKSCEED